MAHTQELVKLMGGTIAVESELGAGTRFTVILPANNQYDLIQDGAIPAYEGQPVSTGSQSGPGSRRSTTMGLDNPASTAGERPLLLLIEDNPDVVTYLRSCLSDIYQLDVAYNVHWHRKVSKTSGPHHQRCDDAREKWLRGVRYAENDERTSHIPIILLTAK
ncbi:MAG: hypothetical protein H6559_01080 [Lewinellaceae bacterium]|nr:hypothetical protein [Lewinellaceae bacterium]